MDPWIDSARGVASIAQIVAILVGGSWAYLKFVRGRVLAQRAELSIRADLLSDGSRSALLVHAVMKNTGTTQIDLVTKALYLRAAEAELWSSDTTVDWDARFLDERTAPESEGSGALLTAPVFGPHVRLEPNETIADTVLVPVPPRRLAPDRSDWLALQITGVVFSRADGGLFGRRRRRQVKRWTATCVSPGTLQPVHPGARPHAA